MDSFFGIGIAELFFIALIALVVLGPERLPGAIREVSRVFRYVRNLSNELTSQFSEEMKALDDINPQKLLKEFTDGPDEKAQPAQKSAPKVGAMAASAKPLATKKPATPAKPAVRKTGTANDAPKPPVKPAAKPANPTATPTTHDADPASALDKPLDKPEESLVGSPQSAPSVPAADSPADDAPEPTILPPAPSAQPAAEAHDTPSPLSDKPDESEIVVEASAPNPKARVNGTSGHGTTPGGEA